MRKTYVVFALIAALLAAGLGSVAAAAKSKKETKPMQEKTAAGKKKILVVYFSHTGNTRALALQLQALTGGDIFELKPVDAYPAEYRATVDQAKKELQADFKPKLAVKIPDLKQYDTVLIGTPNWWNSVAGPVRTFLAGSDLAGKTVVPFVTHAGSGMGGIQADVAKLCPKSKVLNGTAIWGSSVSDAGDDAAKWLRRIGLLK